MSLLEYPPKTEAVFLSHADEMVFSCSSQGSRSALEKLILDLQPISKEAVLEKHKRFKQKFQAEKQIIFSSQY